MNQLSSDGQSVIDANDKHYALDVPHPMPLPNGIMAVPTDGKHERKAWKSIARWPVEAGVMNDESSDDHYTEAEAIGVCDLLRINGYGGDREFFPTLLSVAKFAEDGTLIFATRIFP